MLIAHPVPASTEVQPRRRLESVHWANSARWRVVSRSVPSIVNFDEDPPISGSAFSSATQSPTAFGGSTVSASRQITMSVDWQCSFQARFSASDLRCSRRGSSMTSTGY